MRSIEADLHLFRGRLEVRHLKTLGPVPILWDRWRLANPFAPRLAVTELLEAVGSHTELLLDLKGANARLSSSLVDLLEPGRGLSITVCARHWPLLEPFEGLSGVRLVHSVGSARDLRRLRRRAGGRRLAGITIHERLLDSHSSAELRELADTILTWPINTVERARELVAWGIDGLISDVPSLVQPVVAAQPR